MIAVKEKDALIENINKLKAYYRKYGNFNIPLNWKEDKQFSQWVENVRKHPAKLSTALKKELNKLKFEFAPSETWNDMFHQLQTFYTRYGHSYVPPFHWEYERLFDWTVRQRQNKNQLTPSQVKRLYSLAFEWELLSDADLKWETRYHELVDFKRQFGHTRIPQDYKTNKALGDWVSKQRSKAALGKLSRFRKTKLNAVGFLWQHDILKLREQAWDARYEELAQYKMKHGHIDRFKVIHEHYQLGLWIKTQIAAREKISERRRQKLDKLGFCWDRIDIYEQRWNEMFERLKAFKKKHGHCRVKKRENFKLSVWLSRNKRDHKAIDVEKRRKLESLGVKLPSELFQEIWQSRFEELLQFKKKHGHLQVPRSMPQLFEWISTQKKFKVAGTLQKERINKLNGLGFLWVGEFDQQKIAAWDTMYNTFGKLKKKYPTTYHIKLRDYPKLAYWVKRQIHSKDKLSQYKKKKLNAIDFKWQGKNYNDQLWDEMYQKLNAYKNKHGHCDVPQRYADEKLGRWVNTQRRKNPSKAQRDKLNVLGFSWGNDVKEKRWTHRLNEYLSLKKEGRHQVIPHHTSLYSWLYHQRKNFKSLPAEKRRLLVKAGIAKDY